MELKYKLIKSAVKTCYKTIEKAERKLKELRESCDHPETELVNYQFRPGAISKATICKFCGEVVPSEDDDFQVWDVTVGDGINDEDNSWINYSNPIED